MKLRGRLKDLEHLPQRVEELKDTVKEERSRAHRLERENLQLQGLRNDYERIHAELEALKKEFDTAEEVNRGLLEQNTDLRAENSNMQSQLASVSQVGVDEARAEAVKQYRLSQDCQARKEDLSYPFIKYGFYLARGWLESKRPEDSFPELVYTKEAREHEPPE